MTDANKPKGERIAKLLARAGIGSRREIERMIGEGRVAIGGKPLETPATLVENLDGVTVDGNAVAAPEPPRLWRYHKPAGLLTTHRDPEGRPTVFDALPDNIPRVISVGRLDMTSEGLLLLTNDGALARHLEHPKTGLVRRYRVRAHGRLSEDAIAALGEGVVIDGFAYGPVEAKVERVQGANSWIELALMEGKNREVRKLLAHFGLTVNRLIRTAYGPIFLGKLEKGAVEAVPFKIWRELARPIAGKLDLSASSLKQRPKGWAKAKPRGRKPPRRGAKR